MPFESKSQQRACYAKDDPDWDCDEWAAKTNFKRLPEKKETKKEACSQSKKGKKMKKKAAVKRMVNYLDTLARSIPPGEKRATLCRINQLAGELEQSGNLLTALETVYPEYTLPQREKLAADLTHGLTSAMSSLGAKMPTPGLGSAAATPKTGVGRVAPGSGPVQLKPSQFGNVASLQGIGKPEPPRFNLPPTGPEPPSFNEAPGLAMPRSSAASAPYRPAGIGAGVSGPQPPRLGQVGPSMPMQPNLQDHPPGLTSVPQAPSFNEAPAPAQSPAAGLAGVPEPPQFNEAPTGPGTPEPPQFNEAPAPAQSPAAGLAGVPEPPQFNEAPTGPEPPQFNEAPAPDAQAAAPQMPSWLRAAGGFVGDMSSRLGQLAASHGTPSPTEGPELGSASGGALPPPSAVQATQQRIQGLSRQQSPSLGMDELQRQTAGADWAEIPLNMRQQYINNYMSGKTQMSPQDAMGYWRQHHTGQEGGMAGSRHDAGSLNSQPELNQWINYANYGPDRFQSAH